MTFYNRIESVRGIAIDLTNGRKWRGASDKAAVFDALDAARREYMRLSDENAKLRELVRDYEHCSMHADCDRCEYDGATSTHCPLSPCFPDSDELRELGVEVSE